MGGIDPAITKAQRVVIHSKDGPVTGVVGNVAPHLAKSDPDRKLPKIEDLFIDIGVSSRKEAERLIRIGDPITLNDPFELLRNDLAVARAFDNRIGTFAVAEALRQLSGDKDKLRAEVLAVSNIMEEVGLLGARQIAYTLKPDVALVVDVTHATDAPGIDVKEAGKHEFGSGPVITRGSTINEGLFELLYETAEQEKIPFTVEASSRATGTDADAVNASRGGVPTALVSIPLRYMHSPVELVQLDDVHACARLIAAVALRIEREATFKH